LDLTTGPWCASNWRAARLAAGATRTRPGQQQYADGCSRNRNQAGDVLQDRSWWIDPTTGQRQPLAYIGPHRLICRAPTGNRYRRDELGRYAAPAPSGQWYWKIPTQ